MIKFGYLLLVLGFLSAAYVVSLDPATVNWPVFAVTIILGFIGVVMVRTARHQAARSSAILLGNRQDLETSLANIVANLEDLKARKETLSVEAFREEIDSGFRDDLLRFVDARESMIPLFGLQAYADIMGAFAAGERFMNRIWSASADGYIDEARAYVDKAHEQFAEADAKLKAAAG